MSSFKSELSQTKTLIGKMILEKDKEIRRLSEFVLIKNNENTRLLEKVADLDNAVKEKDAELEAHKREIKRLSAAVLACKIRAQKTKEDLEREVQRARSEATRAQREVIQLEGETSQLRIALARSFSEMKERCDEAASANCTRLSALLTNLRTFTDQAIDSLKVIVDKSEGYAGKAASIIESVEEEKGMSRGSCGNIGYDGITPQRVLFSPDKEIDGQKREEEGSGLDNEFEVPSTPSRMRMIVEEEEEGNEEEEKKKEEGTPSKDRNCTERHVFVLGTRLSAKARMPSSGNNAVVSSENIFDKENEEENNF